MLGPMMNFLPRLLMCHAIVSISPALLIWFQSENLNMALNVILHREGGELAEGFQNGETSRKETREDEHQAKGDDHNRKGSY